MHLIHRGRLTVPRIVFILIIVFLPSSQTLQQLLAIDRTDHLWYATAFAETSTPPNDDTQTRALTFSFSPIDNAFNGTNFETMRHLKIPYTVRGVYVTGWTAGGSRMDDIFSLIDQGVINAVVIDVKEDRGEITYRTNVALAKETKSDARRYIADIDGLLERLHERNTYTIARIVSFKDPHLADAKPELALTRKTGGVYTDNKGVRWIDPYQESVWSYNAEVAKEVVNKGFREVQLDYVRFPENGKKVDAEVRYANVQGWTKDEVIMHYIAFIRQALQPYPVFLSADVFGLVTTVHDDMGIGQTWDKISSQVDYISPMMYPSHYAPHTYGQAIPDLKPYEIIHYGLIDALKKDALMREAGTRPAVIRPWYQAFTASYLPKGQWMHYDREAILAQIRAGMELGIDSFLLWDPRNAYDHTLFQNGLPVVQERKG
ncbi:MAG: putative glycoside hydrolase [Candidatus Carbobacillus sp.]|nr:putative glycoside hydrolase [Candidatus Carbobacillus sp.]